MAVFLSPGVFVVESDISLYATSAGGLLPAFIGTANKGPMNKPTLMTSASQFIDTFGNPSPESYLGYAVLAYFEEGNQCYVTRIGVEEEVGQDPELAAIAIDTSGANVTGWGRIPLFSGIDFGRINFKAVTASNPVSFHPASVSNITYNNATTSPTHGPTIATLVISGTYTGAINDTFTLLITSAPNLSFNDALSGADFEVIRGSDGSIVASGVLAEPILKQSQSISIGAGLSVIIKVSSGIIDINDTFTFTVQPDNRSFQFSIEGVNGSTYVMPTATYTSVAALTTAINALLINEGYVAVSYTDVNGNIFLQVRTTTAGHWIQLVSSAAWALMLGQQQYAWDIPRSYLLATNDDPYTITIQNNQIVMKAIGPTQTTNLSFTVATGTNIEATQLAANINPAGVIGGNTIFNALELTTPDGTNHLLIITTVAYELYQLQLMASYSNLSTLGFATETGILYPYQSGFRGFTDPRLSVPTSSQANEAIPQSCALNPLSASCANDSAYFQNIVGFLVATSPGTWVNGITVNLGVFSQGVGEVAGRYQITITGANGLVLDVIQDVSFDINAARYIGNVINPGSSIGGASGDSYINWEPRPSFLSYDPTQSNYTVRQPATFGSMPFAGQQDGIITDPAFSSSLDAALIGNPATSTGIFALQNPETYDINLLVTPGFSSGAVIGQCLQMCEARGDVIYLVDPPFGLRPQQVVDWHNGMLLSNLSSAIDSSYGALYWSWVKIFDQFSGQEIWIPPSGPVSAIFSRTSRVANQWSAPAGLNRGILLTALDVEYSPSQSERDLLYGYGNAVNPLVNFPQSGITIWGQRTLQREQTALDRVNVRMLLIYLKKNLVKLLRAFLFEPNDSILQAQVVATLDPFMANVQALRGTIAYKIVCDGTNNSASSISQNQLNVTVFLMPTLTAEFISLNLVIMSQNASFSSSESLAAGGIVSNQ